jgi:hypothetical protein
MIVVVVIGGVAYSSSGVAYSGFSGTTHSWGNGKIFNPSLELVDDGYSSFEFSSLGCGPAIPFVPGLPIRVYDANDDGSAPALRFVGDIQKPDMKPTAQGPAWGYYCSDLRMRGDNITLLAPDGTSVANFNLRPTDPLYLFFESGKTVGQIVTQVLQATINASALAGVGVGNYTIVGSVYTLPSTTAADLAALTIVPPNPVQLQGESILSRLAAFIQEWHSQIVHYVQPDGTLRFVSIFGRTAHTLTQPSPTVVGDPVFDFDYSMDATKCFGAVSIVGQDIAGATLSLRDQTLLSASSDLQYSEWTSGNYNTAANSNDDGLIISVTSNSCVVKSLHPRQQWVLNYWQLFGGEIQVINSTAVGVAITETRQITACTAMAPGGTATITWDSSLPLDTTAYTTYRLFSTASPLNLVDRAFWPYEVSTGKVGLDTYIGSHMEPIFPYGFPWFNQGLGNPSAALTYLPAALVLWSPNGAWPWFSAGIPVQINPVNGTIVLSQPAVFLSAAFAGTSGQLAQGYPPTLFQGRPYDVQIVVPYNRGDVNARFPTSGYQGTAYTKYGLNSTKVIPLSNFIWKGDTASLTALAEQVLLTIQDIVVQGSIKIHYDAWTPTFDVFAVGQAIEVATPGAASEIDGLNLPVRSTRIEWPNEGPDQMRVTLGFNNRHRAFEGDALYIHPQFDGTLWGMQGVDSFAMGDSSSGTINVGFGDASGGFVSQGNTAEIAGGWRDDANPGIDTTGTGPNMDAFGGGVGGTGGDAGASAPASRTQDPFSAKSTAEIAKQNRAKQAKIRYQEHQEQAQRDKVDQDRFVPPRDQFVPPIDRVERQTPPPATEQGGE